MLPLVTACFIITARRDPVTALQQRDLPKANLQMAL